MLDTSPSAANRNRSETPYKKKLIEVALPLQAINAESRSEKSPQRGRPSTLHMWWARRPLAACRAVIFASLVDDPSSDPETFPTAEDQERKRKQLFDLIEDLVKWENSLNEQVLERARVEIRRCVGDDLPTVYDPFCGGGAIPIEAQRLGLPTLASDVNPVAVLITKALTEIPFRFKERRPVHPSFRGPLHDRTWERATGLAADVESYGRWMLDEARNRIGSYYPKMKLSDGQEGTVIAWLWARTVRCNNPVCGAQMPLVKSFALSTKIGKEWSIEPIIDHERKTVRFQTRPGAPLQKGTIDRRGARCIVCGEPVSLAYVRSEGRAGRIAQQMLAIVAEVDRVRVYLPPDDDHERIALSAKPAWSPDTDLVYNPRHMSPPLYGMTKHRDLFTGRQLVALTTFSDLVKVVRERVLADAIAAGLPDDGIPLESGGSGSPAYADAIATYLALAVDRMADYNASLCSWHTSEGKITHVFTRQTISMVWDFAEAQPLAHYSGSLSGAVDLVKRVVATASAACSVQVFARDAASEYAHHSAMYCTDPPYYDNVPYADLSDFFYVWLRSSLASLYPDLLATVLVPKTQELVADPARFGDDRKRARSFFESGLGDAFRIMRKTSVADVPTTIFYAFKQTETDRSGEEGTTVEASVGWEAMLNAVLNSGFQIDGTWPMTSEMANRTRGQNSNALASSIVFVCRPRAATAAQCTRLQFVGELRAELPQAVRRLRDASLAATDLQQAALGPGMAIFSKYLSVLEPDDRRMTVRSALSLINDELTQILLGEIADVDAETHFALAWFDRYGYTQGLYGDADVLLKAKNSGLGRLVDSGVLLSGEGRVALLSPLQLSSDGAPATIRSYPAWAQTMHMLAALLGADGGEQKASETLRAVGAGAERIKDIAYHCYLVCERTKRLAEARDFNALVTVWPDLERRASELPEDRLL